MPGPASAWLPTVITVDGTQRSAIALATDGFALLRLEKGVHRVRLEGFAPPGESLTLAFGDHPKHLAVHAKGWEVDGLRDNGRADASIQLRRTLLSQGKVALISRRPCACNRGSKCSERSVSACGGP